MFRRTHLANPDQADSFAPDSTQVDVPTYVRDAILIGQRAGLETRNWQAGHCSEDCVIVTAEARLPPDPEFRRAVWSVCSFEWFLHPKGRTNYRTVTGSIIERPAMIFAANDVAAAVTDWPVTGSEESPDGYEQLSW
jgi:hypothetical protein